MSRSHIRCSPLPCPNLPFCVYTCMESWRIASLLYGFFAKETYNVIDPTNHSLCIHMYGVMAHIWMSHGTHLNESWRTLERVLSRSHKCCRLPCSAQLPVCVYIYLWSHVTQMNESCHMRKIHFACIFIYGVTSHIGLKHVTSTNICSRWKYRSLLQNSLIKETTFCNKSCHIHKYAAADESIGLFCRTAL